MPDIKDRGMIKWQPFDSLTSTSKLAKEILKEKEKVKMPVLSSDQINYIEQTVLDSYVRGEEIKLSYYKNGYIITKLTTIKYLDNIKKQIILNDKTIVFFKQITKIEQF